MAACLLTHHLTSHGMSVASELGEERKPGCQEGRHICQICPCLGPWQVTLSSHLGLPFLERSLSVFILCSFPSPTKMKQVLLSDIDKNTDIILNKLQSLLGDSFIVGDRHRATSELSPLSQF